MPEHGEPIDEVRHRLLGAVPHARSGSFAQDAALGPPALELQVRQRHDGDDAAGEQAEHAPEHLRREPRDVDERQPDQPEHRERDAVEQRLRREHGRDARRARLTP